MGFFKCVSLVLALLVVCGTTRKVPEAPPTDDVVMSDMLNTFAFNFQRKIHEGEAENSVFSPFSVYSGLAMLHLGATGKTRKQIAKAMMWTNDNGESLLKALKSLTNKLDATTTDGVTVNSAVNGWLSEDFKL